MADYAALIAKWATLDPGTTAQKLAQINAITVTGSVPTAFSVSAIDLYEALDAGEWNTLCSSTVPADMVNVAHVRDILRLSGQIPVGAGTTPNLLLFHVFGSSPATLLNLGKLAVAQVQTWWQSAGYLSPVQLGDVIAAGLS